MAAVTEESIAEESKKGAVSTSKPSAGIGLLLMLVGAGFYQLTERKSKTALAPAFVGLPVLLCHLAILATEGGNKKIVAIAAHVAVLLTSLGTLGGAAMGVVGTIKGKPWTTVADCTAMALLCAAHVGISVSHFIRISKMKKQLKGK
eukprot:TRINITY_DN22112_c3_g1_i1.p1 TRINITY_DN22112_c3_g1~~TRINITY_DN22112_c3_g1_i1.p1  ORF type:complete len:147 (+),score=39.89 TRINITY_DN22112_c3_g1_i1:68-508(+)